jgi:hypothetical protein
MEEEEERSGEEGEMGMKRQWKRGIGGGVGKGGRREWGDTGTGQRSSSIGARSGAQ